MSHAFSKEDCVLAEKEIPRIGHVGVVVEVRMAKEAQSTTVERVKPRSRVHIAFISFLSLHHCRTIRKLQVRRVHPCKGVVFGGPILEAFQIESKFVSIKLRSVTTVVIAFDSIEEHRDERHQEERRGPPY